MNDWIWQCPICLSTLEEDEPHSMRCTSGHRFPMVDGTWRLVQQRTLEENAKFISDYSKIREAEGRGSQDASYYCGLPFQSPPQLESEWQIRAIGFRHLEQVILPQLSTGSPLRILDMGCGNCWLAARLARLGHEVMAIDLRIEGGDALSAHVHYKSSFAAVQADFSRLPLADSQADAIVWNASFHYSSGYEEDLREALRVLSPKGHLVILDSPIYSDAKSGRQMLREQREFFSKRYGTFSDTRPMEGFLTWERLDDLSKRLSIDWKSSEPAYGIRWKLRPWMAKLRGRREPATFKILIGNRQADET